MLTYIDKLFDLNRNILDLPPELADNALRLFEMLTGRRMTSTFFFPNPNIRNIYDASSENAPRFDKSDDRVLDPDIDPETKNPLLFRCMWTIEKNQWRLLAGFTYKKNAIIMNIWGTFELPENCNLDVTGDEVQIKSKSGLILRAKPYGGMWAYLKKSCQPNCEVIQRWIKDQDGKYNLEKSLMAIKDISIGEMLSACPNHLLGTNEEYDCDCGHQKCIRDQKSKWKCMEDDCPRKGKKFPNEKSYMDHVKAHERDDMIKARQMPPEQEEHMCEHPDCCMKDKGYTTRAALLRHQNTEHVPVDEKYRYRCPHCNEGFTRKELRDKHVYDRKNPCKAHKEMMMKSQSTTELGPRKKVKHDPSRRVRDGYVVVKRTGSSEEEYDEDGVPIPPKTPRQVSAPLARTVSAPPAPRKRPVASRMSKRTSDDKNNDPSTGTERQSRPRTVATVDPSAATQAYGLRTRGRPTTANPIPSRAADCQPSTSAQAYGTTARGQPRTANPLPSSAADCLPSTSAQAYGTRNRIAPSGSTTSQSTTASKTGKGTHGKKKETQPKKKTDEKQGDDKDQQEDQGNKKDKGNSYNLRKKK